MIQAHEVSFLLMLARIVCGKGWAMRFWREGLGLAIEVEPPYSVAQAIVLTIDRNGWAHSDKGSAYTVADVADRFARRFAYARGMR